MAAPLSSPPPSGRVRALLGPTNTGKTHFAVERMLAHPDGMIGLPLRLLAREVYDRIVGTAGTGAAALITGEEKIVPPTARYWVCTTESMPVDKRVAFVALDEVQLCADPERGHVFTDRVLNLRGTQETILLGADTARGPLTALLKDLEVESRPRLSKLTYGGVKKLSRLSRRTAVVAFSTNDVYAIAELVRRQRGGAAVVLGALSPRTRNAQVAMYQAGEVDYLVATDAVGMGLNMDVDHVSFARLRKFDGRRRRPLTPAEIGQIAGRAGRHMNDGTFGTTAEVGPMDPDTIERVEGHAFEPLTQLCWRNPSLDFDSVEALLAALDKPAPRAELTRPRDAVDLMTLRTLSKMPEVAVRATQADRVAALWQVCQIPDFRKTLHDDHGQLCREVFVQLIERGGTLEDAWVAGQVDPLDRTDGDIDTLTARLAGIRTWTFIAHRGTWLGDADHWQDRTRQIEDKLSDALHEGLTQRFVDRRTGVLLSRLEEEGEAEALVDPGGVVTVEGHRTGILIGFRYQPDEDTGDAATKKKMRNAALRALRGEAERRLDRVLRAPEAAFTLTADGRIAWLEAPVGRLLKGDTALSPRVAVLDTDLLDAEQRGRLEAHLASWLDGQLAAHLAPLKSLATAEIEGPARGLAFQLAEGLGVVPRGQVAPLLNSVDPEGRRALKGFGVWLGFAHLYLPTVLKPAPSKWRTALWGVWHDKMGAYKAPGDGLMSVPADPDIETGFYTAAGYGVVGGRAIRVDILERLALAAHKLAETPPFQAPPEFAAIVGCSRDQLPDIMVGLGYRKEERKPAPPAEAEAGEDPAAAPPAAPPEATEAATEALEAAPEKAPAPAPKAPEIEIWYHLGRRPRAKDDDKKPGGRSKRRADGDAQGKPRRGKGGKPPEIGETKTDRPPRKPRRTEKPIDPDSPFAKLAQLKLKRGGSGTGDGN